MAATDETPTPATEAPVKGWGPLPCPRCGEEACVQLDLDDLTNFTCRECSEEFTAADLEAIIAAWGPVLAWIRQAPALAA